jgi:uncharacterized damage-inducible protein DinB
MVTETDQRYPIGKYVPQPFSEEAKHELLRDIQFFPNDIEVAIQNLDASQLDTPYREGGWTVKQLVHHMADSHMNAYIRFKLGLTEENPTITPYEENDWAVLDDVYTVPINVSITLLHALHLRWHAVLKGLTEEKFNRTIFHPHHKKDQTLWFLLGLYAWHGRHHVAHITSLKERNNW